MIEKRFIVAIDRIERALSRVENAAIVPASADDYDLVERHEKLKSETRMAIQELDKILAGAR